MIYIDLNPGLGGQRTGPEIWFGVSARNANRRQGRAQARVAEAAVRGPNTLMQRPVAPDVVAGRGRRGRPGLDAHRCERRAQARVAEAAVRRAEARVRAVRRTERMVSVDGVHGRLDRSRTRVARVRAVRESHRRLGHAVHRELVGWPPLNAHEHQQRDSLWEHEKKSASAISHT